MAMKKLTAADVAHPNKVGGETLPNWETNPPDNKNGGACLN